MIACRFGVFRRLCHLYSIIVLSILPRFLQQKTYVGSVEEFEEILMPVIITSMVGDALFNEVFYKLVQRLRSLNEFFKGNIKHLTCGNVDVFNQEVVEELWELHEELIKEIRLDINVLVNSESEIQEHDVSEFVCLCLIKDHKISVAVILHAVNVDKTVILITVENQH